MAARKTKVVDESYDDAFDRYYAMPDQELLWAAQADQQAMKEASAAGQPIPVHAALDAFHRRHKEGTTLSTRTTKKSNGSARSKGRTDIRYFHDGRSLSEGHKHKLSTLCYFYSFNLDGNKPRIGTKEFIDVLHKAGVKDPAAPGWMVTLKNGVTVECRKDGEASHFKGDAATNGARKPAAKRTTKPAAKATSKAADKPLTAGQVAYREGKAARATKATTAKKATAKKATTAKATSASARAKAGVKPNPKKASGKAAAKRTTRTSR